MSVQCIPMRPFSERRSNKKIGLNPAQYGTHYLRRTKATPILDCFAVVHQRRL